METRFVTSLSSHRPASSSTPVAVGVYSGLQIVAYPCHVPGSEQRDVEILLHIIKEGRVKERKAYHYNIPL